ncbi:MAG: helix-turn-helix transcriptional regulator [Gluconacetobacter diazotrophicus]|nr:helix-turn-helix transcriptional regulator [Gluconacetobacter diazotrophicus]
MSRTRHPRPARPDASFPTLEAVFRALGDPVRLGVVLQLRRDGPCSCAVLDGGRPKSTMSHHFRVLRRAGLVLTEIRGTTHMNTLCAEAVEARFPGLLALLDAEAEPPAELRPPPRPSGG